ncbi:hypothetical protein ACVNP1_00700 [Staphylococcus aureus]
MVGQGLAIKAHEESKVMAPFNGLVIMIVPTQACSWYSIRRRCGHSHSYWREYS